ncbi:conserved hypothetical protein [Mesorhizobium sp. SOD10]|nr:conserved hypothetical protein [Mesorhizobium sp. SOD10]
MKFLLDEGVPVSVGSVLEGAGHEVIFFQQSGLAKGTVDAAVCAAAESNDAILVAADKDMKTLARGHGITPARFRDMGLLRFECPKPMAAKRIEIAMTLLAHELAKAAEPNAARFYVVIGEGIIRTHR